MDIRSNAYGSWARWLLLAAMLLGGLLAQHAYAEDPDAAPRKLFTHLAPVDAQRALPEVALAMHGGSTALATADASAISDDDELLAIDLPGGAAVMARKSRFETQADGTGVWYGEVQGKDRLRTGAKETPSDSLNSVVLVRRGNHVGGVVEVQGQLYQVLSSTTGQTLVTRIDPASLPPEHPPGKSDAVEVPGDSQVSNQAGAISRSAAGAHSTIHVGFVTTREVRQLGIDLNVLASAGLALVNQSNVNSQVHVTFENAGVFDADYSETSAGNDMGAMLANLRNASHAALGAPVSRFRDERHADLIVMLTRTTPYCGLAYLLPTPNKSYSFSVVGQSCVLSMITVGHEMGHNFGANHDLAQYSQPRSPSYSHGFRHIAGASDSWRTIMAYACNNVNCPKRRAWSNPNVTYNGIPMGSFQYEDVARVLNANRAAIAAFYPPPPASLPPTAVAQAQPTALTSGIVVLDGSASQAGGGGSLRYEWVQVSGTPALTIDRSDQARASVQVPSLPQATVLGFELIVTAENGLADSQRVTVSVHKASLSATITAPASVHGGEPVPVSAQVVNPSGAPVTYSWARSASLAGSIGNTPNGTYTATDVTSVTNATVALTVTAGGESFRTENKVVTIRPSQPPTGTISGPSSVDAGKSGRFTVEASDPQGGALTYAWTKPSDWDGAVSNSSSVTLTAPNVAQDSHATISVRVRNQAGKTLDLTHAVRVNAPSPQPGQCYEAWSRSKVYGAISNSNPAAKVTHNGRNFEQQWWTQGNEPVPGTQQGDGRPWVDIGPCQ